MGQALHVQKTDEAIYHIDPRSAGVVGFRAPLPAPAVNHFLCQCGSKWIIRVAVMVKQHQVFLIGRIIPSLGRLPVPYKAMDLWGKERTEFFHMDSTSFARGTVPRSGRIPLNVQNLPLDKVQGNLGLYVRESV